MKVYLTSLLFYSARAFTIPRAVSAAASSSSLAATAFAQPDRVVPESLPIVYVYDHCPFCVRVRFALGIKNIKHNVQFMANDDIPTPTALVGKKIAPIFQWADVCMAESLDIIKLVDSDETFGPTSQIAPATDRTDIKEWQKSVRDLLRVLQRPRYVATGLLPEFQQKDSRIAFILNHQMPPYEKADWKENVPVDQRLQIYTDAMESDANANVATLNEKLKELDGMLVSEYYCSEPGLSYDDVDLFARLRSITIIKNVQWPTKLRNYMDNMSALGDVPLYDEMAL